MLEQQPGRWPYYSVELTLQPGEFCQVGDVVDNIQTAHAMAAAAVQVQEIWADDSDLEYYALIYGESRTFEHFKDEPASEDEDSSGTWREKAATLRPASCWRTSRPMACICGNPSEPSNSVRLCRTRSRPGPLPTDPLSTTLTLRLRSSTARSSTAVP